MMMVVKGGRGQVKMIQLTINPELTTQLAYKTAKKVPLNVG